MITTTPAAAVIESCVHRTLVSQQKRGERSHTWADDRTLAVTHAGVTETWTLLLPADLAVHPDLAHHAEKSKYAFLLPEGMVALERLDGVLWILPLNTDAFALQFLRALERMPARAKEAVAA